MLVAKTVTSGSTNCGSLHSGVWSRVTLVVDSGQSTCDVLIN